MLTDHWSHLTFTTTLRKYFYYSHLYEEVEAQRAGVLALGLVHSHEGREPGILTQAVWFSSLCFNLTLHVLPSGK